MVGPRPSNGSKRRRGLGPMPGHRYTRTVPTSRFRCTTCGNLTRFDVTATRRTRAFHHYTLGGELEIVSETVLDEDVESVACRWCGPSGHVEVVDIHEG